MTARTQLPPERCKLQTVSETASVSPWALLGPVRMISLAELQPSAYAPPKIALPQADDILALYPSPAQQQQVGFVAAESAQSADTERASGHECLALRDRRPARRDPSVLLVSAVLLQR